MGGKQRKRAAKGRHTIQNEGFFRFIAIPPKKTVFLLYHRPEGWDKASILDEAGWNLRNFQKKGMKNRNKGRTVQMASTGGDFPLSDEKAGSLSCADLSPLFPGRA